MWNKTVDKSSLCIFISYTCINIQIKNNNICGDIHIFTNYPQKYPLKKWGLSTAENREKSLENKGKKNV